MDNPRQPDLETRDSGESPESVDRQKLDDATFEPESFVERTADFRQAESIQQNLAALVETAPPADSIPAVVPHRPEEADRSKVSAAPGEGGSGKVDAIPITVPDVRAAGDEASSLPLPLPGGKTGPALIPENDTTPHAGSGGQADVLPLPLPSPGEDISTAPRPRAQVGDEGRAGSRPKVRDDLDHATTGGDAPGGADATPINLPGPQAASRTRGEADTLPVPLPSPGAEVSATPITLPGKPGAGKTARGNEPGDAKPAGGEADTLPEPLPSPGAEGAKTGPALIPENDMTPHAGSGGQADSLPLPIPSPKESPSGRAADLSANEQLNRRKQKGAGDIDSAVGK
jgi:hypothetical protein